MKSREERQKVMIKARMRTGGSWHDVCILNLSVRGLGIQAAQPPADGTYVEICRRSHVIIARVVWSKGHRAGLRAQDPIFIRGIASEQGEGIPLPGVVAGRPIERRRAPRTIQQRYDRSRLVSRTMEFACFALFAGALAMIAFDTVGQALAEPFSHISAAFG